MIKISIKQHHMSPSRVQYDYKYIVFLLKMPNLDAIIMKHQTNPK